MLQKLTEISLKMMIFDILLFTPTSPNKFSHLKQQSHGLGSGTWCRCGCSVVACSLSELFRTHPATLQPLVYFFVFGRIGALCRFLACICAHLKDLCQTQPCVFKAHRRPEASFKLDRPFGLEAWSNGVFKGFAKKSN